MNLTRSLVARHKLASISLAFCALQIVIIWGAVAFVHSPGEHTVLLRVTSAAWILGSLTSVVFATLTIILDSPRRIGVLALVLALAAFVLCGLPLLA
jgi:hypothetical protein